MNIKRNFLAAFLATGVLLVSACGGDTDNKNTDPGSGTTGSSSSEPSKPSIGSEGYFNLSVENIMSGTDIETGGDYTFEIEGATCHGMDVKKTNDICIPVWVASEADGKPVKNSEAIVKRMLKVIPASDNIDGEECANLDSIDSRLVSLTAKGYIIPQRKKAAAGADGTRPNAERVEIHFQGKAADKPQFLVLANSPGIESCGSEEVRALSVGA